MVITGIVAQSVIVADELKEPKKVCEAQFRSLMPLLKNVIEECAVLKTGRTSEEDTE
jgi:hypothetical protein